MNSEGWKTYNLEDVLERLIDYRGKTPNKTDRGVPLITAKVVKKGTIQTPDEFIAEDNYDTWMVRGLPKVGDVVLTTEAPLGEVAQLSSSRVALAQRIVTLRGEKGKLDNTYLKYFLMSSIGQSRLKERETGTTVTGIKQSQLRLVKIDCPAISKQETIASILSALDDKIELNNRMNKVLELMAQSIFKQWFVDFEFPKENGEPYKSSGGEMVDSDLGKIPERWEVKELGEIVDFQNGYAFKSSELLDEDVGQCYHVFKMGHINKGGGLDKSGTKSYFERSKSSNLSRYVIKKGDLLMCMTDMKSNVALLGYTALMDENDKYILNQRVGLIRTKDSKAINYPYLYILTNSQIFIDNLRSRANSGVQVNLSTSEIKASKIIVPSPIVHKMFDHLTMNIYEKLFSLGKANEYVSSLRDTLLPKLMSGEIDVSQIEL